MKEETKTKTIYDLKLNEGLEVVSSFGGKIEITRVPGGWTYSFEFAGWRQTQVIFVPFNNEFMKIPKAKK